MGFLAPSQARRVVGGAVVGHQHEGPSEEKVDNNNLASETNRNLTLATKTDDQGIEADKHRTRLILTPSGADTFLSLS